MCNPHPGQEEEEEEEEELPLGSKTINIQPFVFLSSLSLSYISYKWAHVHPNLRVCKGRFTLWTKSHDQEN
jgi:hypothetical protein